MKSKYTFKETLFSIISLVLIIYGLVLIWTPGKSQEGMLLILAVTVFSIDNKMDYLLERYKTYDSLIQEEMLKQLKKKPSND